MIMKKDEKRQCELYTLEYENKVLKVLRSGWYILGNEVESFEKEWAEYIGSKYCKSIGNNRLGINR